MNMMPVEDQLLQLPPQAFEAEQSIIGSMMLNRNVIDDVLDVLTRDDFYRNDHAEIFEVIRNMAADSKSVDVITVGEELANSGSNIGLSQLGEINKNTPNTTSVKSYVKIVKDKAMLRQLIESSNEAISSCYKPEGSEAIDIVSNAATRISAIEQDSSSDDAPEIKNLITGFVDELESRFKSESTILGISTGFTDLDYRWGGLEGGKIYVVAGRPKMGKSTKMLNMAVNVARAGIAAHIFTLEMPKMQVVNKIISNVGNVDYSKIRNPKTITCKSDWSAITNGTQIAKGMKIIIDDQPRLSINQIRARLRSTVKKYGKTVVFIDYLQLMRVDDSKNLVEAIGDITSRLKEMAKSFDVPVVLLSQLNRSVDARPNKRPVPSDLRSSGSIEQDADVVAFVYRDEVYDPNTEQKGIAEIITSAIRDGEAGTDRFIFNGDRQRFENFKKLYGIK